MTAAAPASSAARAYCRACRVLSAPTLTMTGPRPRVLLTRRAGSSRRSVPVSRRVSETRARQSPWAPVSNR